MTLTIRPARWSPLYIVMATLIAIVIASIVVEIGLAMTGHGEVARLIEPVTFGLLSVFFLTFGIYYGKKNKPLQSTGGYVGAGVWALYSILLVVGIA